MGPKWMETFLQNRVNMIPQGELWTIPTIHVCISLGTNDSIRIQRPGSYDPNGYIEKIPTKWNPLFMFYEIPSIQRGPEDSISMQYQTIYIESFKFLKDPALFL